MGGISANKAGLVVGSLVGGWHLLWAILVALQVAQPVIDFVFWMHFIKPTFVIEPFSFDRAIVLIVVTAVVGYAAGSCFGLLWNRLRRQDAPFAHSD